MKELDSSHAGISSPGFAAKAHSAIGDENENQAGAKGPPLLPLSSGPAIVDVTQLNKKVSVAESLAADSKAQLLAAEGKANSNNCRAEWARFMRRTKRKDFALRAELEANPNDMFNTWLQEREDLRLEGGLKGDVCETMRKGDVCEEPYAIVWVGVWVFHTREILPPSVFLVVPHCRI